MLIYKILTPEQWQDTQKNNVFLGAPIDLADGYIHFSTAEQLAETLRKHFSAHQALYLAAVDSTLLGDCLKWEPSRGGALFPHLYHRLNITQIRWALALKFQTDGAALLPRDLEHGIY